MLEHIRQRQQDIMKGINTSIGGVSLSEEQLEKACNDYFEKAGNKAVIGETRTFGGRTYIRTASGWKYHGKGTGTKAQEHKDAALDHHVEQNVEWDHGLKSGDQVKHDGKQKIVSEVAGNTLKFKDGSSGHVAKTYDKDGNSYARNQKQKKESVKLHGDDNVAIHENAEQIAAHHGMELSKYKQLHPTTKRQLLTQMKVNIYHEKMKDSKKSK